MGLRDRRDIQHIFLISLIKYLNGKGLNMSTGSSGRRTNKSGVNVAGLVLECARAVIDIVLSVILADERKPKE